MPVIIVGTQIMWGMVYNRPILPPGYHYIAKPREWLIAEAPTGRRYYVAFDRLYRQRCWWDECSKCHLPVPGYHIDDNETIELPQKQLSLCPGTKNHQASGEAP